MSGLLLRGTTINSGTGYGRDWFQADSGWCGSLDPAALMLVALSKNQYE